MSGLFFHVVCLVKQLETSTSQVEGKREKKQGRGGQNQEFPSELKKHMSIII